MLSMRTRAVLERLDHHMDRMDGHMERIDGHTVRADERWAEISEEIRLTRVEIELSRQQRDRHAEMYADLRLFTRDMMRRMERQSDAVVAELRELGADSRAQRQALLLMLDRIEPGGPPPGA